MTKGIKSRLKARNGPRHIQRQLQKLQATKGMKKYKWLQKTKGYIIPIRWDFKIAVYDHAVSLNYRKWYKVLKNYQIFQICLSKKTPAQSPVAYIC